jgi:hypothetical protein
LGSPNKATETVIATPPAQITLSVSPNPITGAGTITFTGKRIGSTIGAASAILTLTDGTAHAGVNYTTFSPFTFSWSNGDGADKTKTTTSLDDASGLLKSFTGALGTPVNASLGTPNSVTEAVQASSPAASTFTITASPNPIAGAGTITFTCHRAGSTTGAAGVTVTTADGTGVAGTNYNAISPNPNTSTCAWANGDGADKTITTTSIDAANGSSTTFTATLSGASGGTIGSPGAVTETVNATGSGGGSFPVSINASRTTCAAPCFVYFSGLQTDTNNNGQHGTAAEWFGDIVQASFKWNFGDSTAAGKTWAYGAQAAASNSPSKNVDHGFETAHIFEQPGTYTVVLVVTRASDGVQSQSNATITVNDWNNNGGSTPTYCFSTSGTFPADASVCGTGGSATRQTQTNVTTAVNNCTSTGTRIARCIFRGGENFNGYSGLPSVAAQATDDAAQATLIISGDFYGYGTGKAELSVKDTAFQVKPGTQIVGFKYDDSGQRGGGGTDASGFKNLLYWNNELSCTTCSSAFGNLGIHSGIMENYFHDMHLYCWGDWTQQYGAQMGNKATRCAGGGSGHDFRNAAPSGMIMSHQLFTGDAAINPANGGSFTGWKLNAQDNAVQPPIGAGIPTEFVWFYDNECVVNGTSFSFACMVYEPQFGGGCNCTPTNGCAGDTPNEPMARGIFDANFLHFAPGILANSTMLAVTNCDSCVLRNNVIQRGDNGGQALAVGSEQWEAGSEPTPAPSTNNIVEGNSFWNLNGGSNCSISSIGVGDQRCAAGADPTTNTTVRNNLDYHAQGTATSCGFISNNSHNFTSDHNLQPAPSNTPYATAAPTTLNDFKLKSCVVGTTGCPINAGQTDSKLWLDMLAHVRGLAQPDIGAHEFGAPPD